MAKSEAVPFMIRTKKETKIHAGQHIEIDGVKSKITSIKTITFKPHSLEVVGMCREIVKK